MALANRIERKINRLLVVKKSSKEIFDELTIHLFQKKLTQDEKNSIYNFGIQSGHYQQTLGNFVELFHEKSSIPWAHYIWILNRFNIIPPKDIVESFVKGIRRQKQMQQFLFSRSWEKYDPRISEYRNIEEQLLREKHSNKKQSLLEKIEFYRSQRMIEEEKRALLILIRMFPEDEQITNEYKSFQKRWAHEVIALNAETEFRERFEVSYKPTKEEQKIALSILKQAVEICKANPTQNYNFAVLFKVMQFPEYSLKILETVNESWDVVWLKVEILIDAKRFVDCLNLIHEIELRYPDNPEVTFAATYCRARALKGLGQNAPAIDLLRSIVNVRPDYRSAFSLISEWANQNL